MTDTPTQIKVPRLRFPGFSGSWEEKKLGGLCEKISDGLHSTPNYDDNGGYYFINGNNLVNGKIVVDDKTKKVSKEEFERYKKDLGDNTILLSINGTIGNISYYNNEQVVLGKSACYINISQNIQIHFLYNYLQNNKTIKYFNSELTGSTIKNLGLTTIKNTPMHIPNMLEQTKIAEFLFTVDEKITQLSNLKTAREQYKKAMMQQIFSQQIRFLDDQGDVFPEWEEKKLGEFLKQKSIKNQKHQVELVLSVNNKKGFVTQHEQFDGHQVASKDLGNYKIVSKNDFAYNPSRINVGSIASLKLFDQGIVSPMYVVFTLKESLDIVFFEKLYNTHKFKHLIKIGCSGSVRDSLNFDDMANFIVSIPTLPEQIKIAEFLSEIDAKISEVDVQIEKAVIWKKGLLQGLFI